VNPIVIAWTGIAVLLLITIVLLAAESWREASRRIDADIAFLRAIPEGMEDTAPELSDPSGQLRAIRNERERRKMPQDREWS
jgi:hypothetical protein